MKTKLMALTLLALLSSQAAFAAIGDLHCTYPTNKGMSFLVIEQAQSGFRVDLNVMGERVGGYETAIKTGDSLNPKYTSKSVKLILDLENTYQGTLGSTGADGRLTLADSSFGVQDMQVKCEVQSW